MNISGCNKYDVFFNTITIYENVAFVIENRKRNNNFSSLLYIPMG